MRIVKFSNNDYKDQSLMNSTVGTFTVSTKIEYMDAAVASPIHFRYTLLNVAKMIRPA